MDFVLPNTGPDLSVLEFEQIDEELMLDIPPLEAHGSKGQGDDPMTGDVG